MRTVEQHREQALALAWHHVLDAHDALRRGAQADEVADRLRGTASELGTPGRELLVAELARVAVR